MTKIDIFSGFLGAGKTTLIKKLIKEAYVGEKLVLIENEFGEIGIDGGFLQDAGIKINELNSGCICCSLVGDFSKALERVYEEYHPDRILIEPSGVGKLSDVIRAVEGADLKDCKINAYTAVVDAAKCKVYMKNFGEFFNDQIQTACCIVFSHTDVTSQEKLLNAVDLVREKNGAATIVTTPWNELDGKEILSAMEHSVTLQSELEELEHEHHHGECCCGHHHHEHNHDHKEGDCCGHHHHEHDHDHEEEECCCGHHHHEHDREHEEGGFCGHHHHEHDREHHHADEVFTSWGVETGKKFNRAELEKMLLALSDERYGTVLRAKGIVAADDGKWIHFDYVPGEPEVREGTPSYTGRLCVIGSKIDEQKLALLFGV